MGTTKHHEEALKVLNLSISQEFLGSEIPARFAYTARDGSPRVVSVGLHWNRAEIVVCTTTNAKKVPALMADAGGVDDRHQRLSTPCAARSWDRSRRDRRRRAR